MTDTLTAPASESAAAPEIDGDTLAASEVIRLVTGGAAADGTSRTLEDPDGWRRAAAPVAQAFLEALRGCGLRPKPETVEQVHDTLGRLAVAAITTTKNQESVATDDWWDAYAEHRLLGHFVERLDHINGRLKRTSPTIEAAFAAAAAILVDDAFDTVAVTVQDEDRSLLLDIGRWTSMRHLIEIDQDRTGGSRGEDEIRAAVDRLVQDGIVYSMKDWSQSYLSPTPVGTGIRQELEAEREARRQAREAEKAARRRAQEAQRDAAVDALLPDLAAAYTALGDAYTGLIDAGQHLETCDHADSRAAVERFAQAQTAAETAVRTWTTIRNRLDSHLCGNGHGWPDGGRDRVTAALAELGIALDGNLTGPPVHHEQVLADLIAHLRERLPRALAAPRPQPAGPAADVPDPRIAKAEQLASTWRLVALAAAILVLAGPALTAFFLA